MVRAYRPRNERNRNGWNKGRYLDAFCSRAHASWIGATACVDRRDAVFSAHWAQFLAHFPDPIGIGSHASFFVAFFSDFVCGMLLMIGLGTRWAALYCFGNIFVAWAFVHHFAYFGKGPASDHGELMVLYLGALLTLLLAGPGAPSVDRALGGRQRSNPGQSRLVGRAAAALRRPAPFEMRMATRA